LRRGKQGRIRARAQKKGIVRGKEAVVERGIPKKQEKEVQQNGNGKMTNQREEKLTEEKGRFARQE